jgi:hypothetical protein
MPKADMAYPSLVKYTTGLAVRLDDEDAKRIIASDFVSNPWESGRHIMTETHESSGAGEDDAVERSGPLWQDVEHLPMTARVPEGIRRGVFSTGIMVAQTDDHFVIDFLSTMIEPQEVVARVVVTASALSRIVAALRSNVNRYEQQHGKLLPRGKPSAQGDTSRSAASVHTANDPDPPAKSGKRQRRAAKSAPSVVDLFDQLRLPDELACGVTANGILIRHTAEEFWLDFIANFYPKSTVAGRIFMAAGRVPTLLETLTVAAHRYAEIRGISRSRAEE